jgi:hypothetical protein
VVQKGQEEEALREAIFSVAEGNLGGPVKTPVGYHLDEVEGVAAGTQQPLSRVKTTIKQTLIGTNQQKALSTFVENFKKNWQSKTECRSGYVVKDCRAMRNRWRRPPKPPARPNSAGARSALARWGNDVCHGERIT